MNSHQEDAAYTADMFRKDHATSKKDIQENVKVRLEYIMKNAATDHLHSMAYYMKFKALVDKFLDRLENTILFRELEDWWAYDVVAGYEGLGLYLEKNEFCGWADAGRPMLHPVQRFELLEVKANLLTVEDFAVLHDVSVGAVRQWIRRGKIRNALKYANEWRIPELTDTPSRGYSTAIYEWFEELIGLPEEFNFLNDYNRITIMQNEEDKSTYSVALSIKRSEVPEQVIQYSLKDKERLELFCISHPQIHNIPDLTDIVWEWSVYKF